MAEITNEVLKEWRKKAENTWMHSGLGEYTPLEFLELLNYHEARIEALETDVIHARRVADERRSIIESLKSFLAVYAKEDNWGFENSHYANLFINPSRNFDCAEEEHAFMIAKRGLEANE